MAFSDTASGHVALHAEGENGFYGLGIHEVPFDFTQMDVDPEALKIEAKKVSPKLIIIAGSMCLFPYSLQEVRKVADEKLGHGFIMMQITWGQLQVENFSNLSEKVLI